MTNRQTDGWTDGRTNGQTEGRKDGQTNGRIADRKTLGRAEKRMDSKYLIVFILELSKTSPLLKAAS